MELLRLRLRLSKVNFNSDSGQNCRLIRSTRTLTPQPWQVHAVDGFSVTQTTSLGPDSKIDSDSDSDCRVRTVDSERLRL